MKKFALILFVFAFPFSLFHSVQAQQRFDAAVTLGGNVCQVDGDNSGRYNYLGLRAGVGTSFPLSEDASTPWRMVVELAYTQKGSHYNDGNGSISLQYVEVPLMLSYSIDRFRFAAGVAPAVKVGVDVRLDGMHQPDQESLYRSFDWLPLTADARYRFSNHLCLDVRYQRSIVSVYDGVGPYLFFFWNHGAFNRLITFGLAYQL